MEIEREEGEMSDTEMQIDNITETSIENVKEHTVVYKKDNNGLVVEQLEKVDAYKLEERAKRFGFSLTGNRVITQKQIDKLYRNFGIKDGNERHFRFDTIHLSGVDGLTTKEVFEYLEDYKPVAIEWVDDKSCNIVCQDHISVALALLLHSREINDETLREMLREKSLHHWREGIPHPSKDLILLRFATNSDKKMATKKLEEKYEKQIHLETKNPWGDLCRSWGVYDHQEIFQRKLPEDDIEDDETELSDKVQIRNKRMALRLGKRNHKAEDLDKSSSDSEWNKKSKTPRMRMRADDEEQKQTRLPVDNSDKDPLYAPLSIEVINTKRCYVPRTNIKLSEKFRSETYNQNKLKKTRVQSRLGAKVVPTQDNSPSDESTSDSVEYTRSRIQKVNHDNKPKSTRSVWSRLEMKSSSTKELKDLRQKLKSGKQKKTDDLRDVLSKTKQSNLRIEVDNNYANK
ncbi:nuclear cap-binding protein subunit 3-like [Battus philenor]|uniref:nuclear cap-binding protein subunit 3-like n=1 Tax=Battus philenor TaxID=42288 RepID=UPI0035D06EF7